MTPLIAEKLYVLTPGKPGEPTHAQSQVLGPFDWHRQAWLERCAWAYDSHDVPDRAELLTGAALASDYLGRYGALNGGAVVGETVPAHA